MYIFSWICVDVSGGEIMKQIDLNEDLQLMLIAAIRYAIGRESYVPSMVIRYLTRLLPDLSNKTLTIIDRDIRWNYELDERSKNDDSRHGVFGDNQIDKPAWMRFWQDVKDEMERRRKLI